VIPWPDDGPSLVALADEAELPFGDESFDRALLIHAVEASEAVRPMLREVWRVLRGSGRLLVVAPNRRGIWARFENNPFAYGHPFSESQLGRLLRESLFTPLASSAALYVPPSNLRLTLRAATTWERFGERWGLPFPGVIVIECAKQIYAPTPALARRHRLRRRIAMPLPAPRTGVSRA
jgi:SAM-dependent methyltransferase